MVAVHALALVRSIDDFGRLSEMLSASTSWSAAAAGSLVSASVYGLVLVVAVSVCVRLLPGLTAAARSLVWTLVFALVLAMHFVPHVARGAGAPVAALYLNARWSLVAICVWAALSAVRGARLMMSAVLLRGMARRAIPLPNQAGGALVLEVGTGLWRRKAVVCTSADLDRPSVIGFVRPRILMPPSLLEALSASELDQVLLHEMEHLRRGDDWVNLFQKIGLVVFPLNPVLLWVERRLCVERELACDDGVLRATGARKAYASCLAKLAEHSMLLRSGVSLALGALERRSELVRRVHRILAKPEALMGRRAVAASTAVLLVGLVGGAAELDRAPQLVRFSAVESSESANVLPSDGPGGMVPVSAGAGAAALPVAARVSAASPRMVDAVMRVDRQAGHATVSKVAHGGRTAAAARPVRNSIHFSAIRQISAPGASPHEPTVVLTTLESAASTPVAPVQISYTYAAVRMPDGWLILQL